MLKGIGSLIIITASFGLAFRIKMDMREHLKLLYEIRKMLIDLSYGTWESLQPVEIIIGCFVRTENEELNRICRQIAERLMEKKEGTGEEVWRQVFSESRKRLGLTTEEGEIVEKSGSAFFGKSVEENKKHLSYTLEKLNFLIENIRKEQKEKQKVAQTLSVASGLLLILLLI